MEQRKTMRSYPIRRVLEAGQFLPFSFRLTEECFICLHRGLLLWSRGGDYSAQPQISFPSLQMFPLRNIIRPQLVKTLNPDCQDLSQNLQLQLRGTGILRKKKGGGRQLLDNI